MCVLEPAMLVLQAARSRVRVHDCCQKVVYALEKEARTWLPPKKIFWYLGSLVANFFILKHGLMLPNKILGLKASENSEPRWILLPKESTARLARVALELFLEPNQCLKDASWLLGLSVGRLP